MPRPVVSQAAEILYGRLWPQTIEDAANEWNLLLFCEALAGTLFEKVRSYVADRPDGKLGWEIIYDVDECPPEALAFLGQHVGVHFEESLTVAQQRAKIKERPAFSRGTLAAITAAAALHLTGAKFVFIEERAGSPYRLLIRTFSAHTPEPAVTLADILTQKPAGIVLDYAAMAGKTYAQWRKEYKTYAGVKAKGTYAQALAE